MSNVVSEWLIYRKSFSVPKVDIMTNLNACRLRHFSSYKKCVCWGWRGWEWAVEIGGAVNHYVNLFIYRLIHCHLLCVYMDCCELSAHPGRDVL